MSRTFTSYLKIMDKAKKLIAIVASFLINATCCSLIVLLCSGFLWKSYPEYKGSWRDQKSMLDFVEDNVEKYYSPPDKKSSEKQKEYNKFRSQMRKLALKIDAGKIKNEEKKRKVVAIRRQAMKGSSKSQSKIHSFDSRLKRNNFRGKTFLTSGVKGVDVDNYSSYELLRHDGLAGDRYLKIDFDLDKGPVILRNSFAKSGKLLNKSGLSFRACSNVGNLKLRITDRDNNQMSFVLEKITEEWMEYSIDFDKMKKEKAFNKSRIKFIDILFSDQVCLPRSSFFMIDDLSFLLEDKKLILKKTGRRNVNIEGGRPLGTSNSLLRKTG